MDFSVAQFLNQRPLLYSRDYIGVTTGWELELQVTWLVEGWVGFWECWGGSTGGVMDRDDRRRLSTYQLD